jgi:hypothetical protein
VVHQGRQAQARQSGPQALGRLPGVHEEHGLAPAEEGGGGDRHCRGVALRQAPEREVPLHAVPGRIDDRPGPPARAGKPRQQLRGVAHGRRQADALQIPAARRRHAVDQREQVRAAVGARERVDLVHHDEAQVGEDPLQV